MANSRPFMDFLRDHRSGLSHDELSDKLQELVAAVVDEGKGGTLTLKITVKPLDKSGALSVTDEIKVVCPKETKSSSVFYVSPENNLVREDPRQAALQLREIGPATAHRGVA